MRLFISINFDKETIARLAAAQARLREMAHGGRYSSLENMHLTLAFIGETPPERTSAIRRAMEDTPVPELLLTFDHAGRFCRRGGDVWWIGLAENTELIRMRRELLGNLAAQGFSFDLNEYTPHVTLAREVTGSDGINAAKLLTEPFEMHADRISLMQSEHTGGVLRYTELFYRLRGEW